MATIFGFSALQGAHQEAQKSTMVTFPKDSLRLTSSPFGLGAEKLEFHLPTGVGAAGAALVPTEGVFICLIFN
jgi:hypothetical protein